MQSLPALVIQTFACFPFVQQEPVDALSLSQAFAVTDALRNNPSARSNIDLRIVVSSKMLIY